MKASGNTILITGSGSGRGIVSGIGAALAQSTAQPTPPETVVNRAAGLRSAERKGRFEATLEQLNAFARAALEG